MGERAAATWTRRLHLGAGDLRFPGWINLDLEDGVDLRRGLLGWADGSVDVVYSCHFLEHLTHAEGLDLLREVHRVLRPGCAVRIGVPDFELFARAYLERDRELSDRYMERYGHGEEAAFREYGDAAALLAVVHGWGHRAIYDEAILRRQLGLAGFPDDGVVRCAHGSSHYFDRWELDVRFDDHSLFVEAAKESEEPWGRGSPS